MTESAAVSSSLDSLMSMVTELTLKVRTLEQRTTTLNSDPSRITFKLSLIVTKLLMQFVAVHFSCLWFKRNLFLSASNQLNDSFSEKKLLEREHFYSPPISIFGPG